MTEPMEFESVEREPKTRRGLIPGLVLGLVLGGGAVALFRPAAKVPPPAAGKATAYQCPMHPQILQDHAGACPICGMDLVVMEGRQDLQSPGPEGLVTVQIDPQRQQLMGLRTVKPETMALAGEVRAPARVVADESRTTKVTVKLDGFVERLSADFVGRPVKKGDVLFELYSPELLTAQREYLVALRSLEAQRGTPQEARWMEISGTARRRLEFLDVPATLLAELEAKKDVIRCLPVKSPVDGIVSLKPINVGSRIAPGDVALELTDLSRIWVQADLFEADLGRIRVGMTGELQIPALGKTIQGRVTFLDPALDPKSRTLKARLEFPNPGGLLRPEMLGEVVFKVGEHKALTIPTDAVLDSGTRKIVFVDVTKGHFEPREIRTGASGRDRVEVLEGLAKDEAVVTRAAFLVDSESRLQAALAELTKKKGH